MPPEGRPEKKWVQKLDPGFFVSGFGGGGGGWGGVSCFYGNKTLEREIYGNSVVWPNQEE